MAANPSLIERIDIHKSCKALENIVNIFNDYCQVAEALAREQRKLARALKEAVGLKATNELAGNALSAAASLLESLAEVDAKFVKVADKECEGASNDLKKWFKKLAKDEKTHDERIAASNARIKQAGQLYEKKAKKKDRDAADEHSRYVNLLSVLGPEMSQEKHNHALSVTQKHTIAVYSVASCILRTADAEWTRACECVRRFVPIIGHLGEARAFLEGGWLASMPEVPKQQAAVDYTANEPAGEPNQELATPNTVDEMGVRVKNPEVDGSLTPHSVQPLQSPSTSVGPATANSSASSSQMPSQAPADISSRNRNSLPPPSSYYKAIDEKLNTDSVRSIESLSSFPSPPTHFPLPDMARIPSSLSQVATSDEYGATVLHSSPEASDSAGQPTERGVPGKPTNAPFGLSTPALTDESGRSPPTNTMSPSQSRGADAESERETETIKVKPRESEHMLTQDRSSPSPVEAPAQARRASGGMERSDSALSSNSIVASLKDKWTRAEPAPSSPTKDRSVPRVPNKVSELASRYKPSIDTAPLSPRVTGTSSPTLERHRQVSDPQITRDASHNQHIQRLGDGNTNGGLSTGSVPSPSELNIIRRRRRIEELEDLERREQAQVLRERERELEQRAKEVERERERLRTLSNATTSVSMSARPTSNADAAAAVRPHSQHSYSMTSLAVPRGSGDMVQLQRPLSQHGEPRALDLAPSMSTSYSSSSSTSNAAPKQQSDHAPYCGCYTCAAAKYRGAAAQSRGPMQQQPQARPDKEKPKGWMRRLSMPVVSNAFSSSDSKKVYGTGSGIASSRGGFAPSDPSFPRFESDHTGGISNASRPRKLSFGRR